MKTNFAFFLFFGILFVAPPLFGQHQATPKTPIKVYLLGSFHFAQTGPDYDVLSPEHQQSIEALCQLVIAQKPDKVFVERQPEYEHKNKINGKFKSYLKTGELPHKNEIYQVGFRVAKALGHEQVYQCDHPGNYGKYYRAAADYAKKHDQVDILKARSPKTVMREEFKINEDSLMRQLDLLDYMRWINSEQVMSRSHAQYLTTYPQIGSTNYYDYKEDDTLIGAELIADWYRRNIMTYAKMINQLDYTEQSIFLIIGGDHIPILRNLFRDNPLFEVVDPQEWLY